MCVLCKISQSLLRRPSTKILIFYYCVQYSEIRFANIKGNSATFFVLILRGKIWVKNQAKKKFEAKIKNFDTGGCSERHSDYNKKQSSLV